MEEYFLNFFPKIIYYSQKTRFPEKLTLIKVNTTPNNIF